MVKGEGGDLSFPTYNMRVASYNIRYASADDEKTGNAWATRKTHVANLILRHQLDIVGTQEGDALQIADLSALMPGFAGISNPYGGKDNKLHTATIFYKKEKFEVLDSGVFWLSQTPGCESIGWDASDTRLCQWVLFRERTTQKTFYFFNTHYYWRKQVAREESGPLLARKIQEIAGGSPILLTGDFNSRENTPQIMAIKKVLRDAFSVTRTKPEGPEGTGFPGGVFQGTPKGRIDYLFVGNGVEVLDYRVVNDTYGDSRYPSDHLPVVSTVQF